MKSSKLLLPIVLIAAIAGYFFYNNYQKSQEAEVAQQCGEVSITEMNWSSSAVVTAVSKFLMTQGYGCTVSVVPSSSIPALTSMAENGEPDISTELWIHSVPLYAELEKEGKVVTAGNVLSDGGVEGWWIPKYLAEEHPELKTIDGILKHPDWVGGVFNDCPSGWTCETINKNLAQAFELEKNGIQVFNHGSGETLASSIASAFENKKPWFGYYWAPTDILGKYEMVKVDIGPYEESAHSCNVKKDCANPGKSAYPTSRVVTGVMKDFATKNPVIFQLMQQVSFTNDIMGKILAWKKENNASNDEAAVYFLQNYPEVWNQWVSDEAREKLQSFL